MASIADDFDPVKLKQRRSTAKGLVTRRKNELHALIDNNADVEFISTKAGELKNAFSAFDNAYKACAAYISDDTEGSYKDVEEGVIACLQRALINDDIRPEDSVSQAGAAPRQTDGTSHVGSRISRTSSVTSERAKAAACKAALLAEAAAMKEQQQLALEELNLQHKRKELEMRINIAKADAEENAYRELDSEVAFNTSKRKPLPMQTVDITSDLGHGNREEAPVTLPANVSIPMTPWEPLHLPVSREEHHPLLQAMQQGQQQQQQLISLMQLPKVELQTFDGSPMKYWLFIRAFENSVERDLIDDNAKLSRLLQYCTGEAKRVIECCAIMSPSEGYARARQLLKERFGNDFTILESWVQSITQRAPIKSTDRLNLQRYSDDLKSCKEVLNAMGKLSEIDNQTNLVKIVEKLPTYLQNRWKQEVRKLGERSNRRPQFGDIVSFVDKAAQEANDPVYGKVTDVSREKTEGTKR